MPHEPWLYLPSGPRAGRRGRPDPGRQPDVGFDDPELTDQNHLRHLLQVGYTDRLVGQLLVACARTGLLERALLVVTADHGYSFQLGVKSRRLISEDNIEEIAPVPLFVKAPGQTEGQVDRPGAEHRHAADDRGPPRREHPLRAGRPLGLLTRDARPGRDRGPDPRLRARRADRSHGLDARRAARRREHAGCSGRARRARSCTATRGRGRIGSGPHPDLLGRAAGRLDRRPSAARARDGRQPGAVRARVAGARQFLPTRVTGR